MERIVFLHKRLILLVVAADLGAIAAGLAAHFGFVPYWIARAGEFLERDLPTNFEPWAVGLVLALAIIVGVMANAAPCFTPALFHFLPARGRHTPTHRGARELAAFAAGLLLSSTIFGAALGLLGRFFWQALFQFTDSAGRTALTVFGLLGIILLVFGLGEFGYMTPMNWLSGFYHRFERWITRFRGAAYAWFLGLLNSGIFGVGCPYAIVFALFLVAAATGNVVFSALTLLLFAFGRLIFIFFTIFREVRSDTGERVIAAIARAGATIRLVQGALLITFGTYLFIFWWIYASMSAFFA